MRNSSNEPESSDNYSAKIVFAKLDCKSILLVMDLPENGFQVVLRKECTSTATFTNLKISLVSYEFPLPARSLRILSGFRENVHRALPVS